MDALHFACLRHGEVGHDGSQEAEVLGDVHVGGNDWRNGPGCQFQPPCQMEERTRWVGRGRLSLLSEREHEPAKRANKFTTPMGGTATSTKNNAGRFAENAPIVHAAFEQNLSSLAPRRNMPKAEPSCHVHLLSTCGLCRNEKPRR